ncbi:peptidase domain-containing ABC transporter [Acidithiobacillus ferrianus]|uniref:ATP-binding cassette domain-containing protein n=2 Tax=Acidithiobacillus ferrianus TaxID=2678518 RepID=A0A845U7U0_9PROT|nr:peptidase domain-containing ABC transporter [Acidithiobacillus ferrianus]NDU42229.1 ATP-binding cassette domain-containing protein [Acidithiobacillus ferrianus]
MKFSTTLLDGLRFGFARRVPVILQSEASECGLACLAMIAGYHGLQIDLFTLRRQHAISLKGATLAQLLQIAGNLHLDGRPLRLKIADLSRLILPCILHWEMKHFVVLIKVGTQGITIHDPACGVRRVPWSEVSASFTGVALELLPAANFEPARHKPAISLRALTGPIQGLRGALLRIFLLALVLEVLGVLGPFYMQWIIDEVLVVNDHSLLTLLGIAYLFVTAFSTLFFALRSWVVIHINATLGIQWATNVFSHLLRLPLDFFEKRHIGDVVSRYGAIQNIRRTITTNLVSAVLDGIMAVAVLIVIAIYSFRLTAIVVGVFVLYLLLRQVAYLPLRAVTERHIFAAAKQQTYLLEAIRGVQTLKLFNLEEDRTARYANLIVETTNQDVRVQQLSALFGSAQKLLGGVGHIVIIWLAALMVMKNQFTIGMLVAYATFASQFLSRGDGLVNAWIDFKMLRLYGERLADIALTPPEAHLLPVYEGSDPEPNLELRQVSFRYTTEDPWILKGCQLAVKTGQSVAIVGPSGCGKTTLVKLLLGLIAPEEGDVRMGGIDIHKLGLRRYRAMVAAVMQSDQLFAGSIADNIALASPEAHPSEIEQAARMAGIHEQIAAMPMGYRTLVGDMGSALSGGEKQRIILARALFKKPRVLILDEATSHLDVVRERYINDTVSHLSITRIVIAHRPETILQCQLIYGLAGGTLHAITPEQFKESVAVIQSTPSAVS